MAVAAVVLAVASLAVVVAASWVVALVAAFVVAAFPFAVAAFPLAVDQPWAAYPWYSFLSSLVGPFASEQVLMWLSQLPQHPSTYSYLQTAHPLNLQFSTVVP